MEVMTYAETIPSWFLLKFKLLTYVKQSISLMNLLKLHVTNCSKMADLQTFKRLLFDKKTTCMAQILHSLSYKVCSITLPKFNSFGLFILILSTSAIMDQTACSYNVTTSKQVYMFK